MPYFSAIVAIILASTSAISCEEELGELGVLTPLQQMDVALDRLGYAQRRNSQGASFQNEVGDYISQGRWTRSQNVIRFWEQVDGIPGSTPYGFAENRTERTLRPNGSLILDPDSAHQVNHWSMAEAPGSFLGQSMGLILHSVDQALHRMAFPAFEHKTNLTKLAPGHTSRLGKPKGMRFVYGENGSEPLFGIAPVREMEDHYNLVVPLSRPQYYLKENFRIGEAKLMSIIGKHEVNGNLRLRAVRPMTGAFSEGMKRDLREIQDRNAFREQASDTIPEVAQIERLDKKLRDEWGQSGNPLTGMFGGTVAGVTVGHLALFTSLPNNATLFILTPTILGAFGTYGISKFRDFRRRTTDFRRLLSKAQDRLKVERRRRSDSLWTDKPLAVYRQVGDRLGEGMGETLAHPLLQNYWNRHQSEMTAQEAHATRVVLKRAGHATFQQMTHALNILHLGQSNFMKGARQANEYLDQTTKTNDHPLTWSDLVRE